MPDPEGWPDVSGLTTGELQRTSGELAAGLALARPDSPARAAILAYLSAIDAELDRRRRIARADS
jgi:hypothetical protein